MKTLVLRYALLGTAILVVLGILNWLLIARPLGYRAAEIAGYLSMVLALSTIYLAIRKFRQQNGAGRITFRQGFKIGMLISLITSAFFYIYSVVYFMVWGDEFRGWAEEHYQTTMSPEEYLEYQRQVAEMSGLYENIWFQGFVMFMTVLLIGLIITLISAFALRTNRGT